MKTIVEVLQDLLKRNEEKQLENGTNSDSPLWAVITALRGPDGDDITSSLKDVTTARIRGILDLEDKSVIVSVYPLTEVQIERRDQLLEECSSHFAQHFQEAIHALELLGYEVPEKEKLPSRFFS